MKNEKDCIQVEESILIMCSNIKTYFYFHLYCFQENKGDREILNSVEVELHRMKENLSNKINQTTGNDITTELRRKDRELVAKVYYYKYH